MKTTDSIIQKTIITTKDSAEEIIKSKASPLKKLGPLRSARPQKSMIKLKSLRPKSFLANKVSFRKKIDQL